MSNSLLSVFGALLIDHEFREGMKLSPEQTLSDYGFTLTAGEHEMAAQIVMSLRGGQLTPAVDAVSAVCPFWPCGRMVPVRRNDVSRFYVNQA